MSLDDLPEGQVINIQHLFDDAAKYGSIECARLLIEKYGASPHKYRAPPCIFPLYISACNDKPDFIRFLLDNHNVELHAGNGRYAAGPTALWAAISHKSFESVKLLLQHGGPLNHIDKEILKLSEPLNAVLIAQRDGKVEIQTETNAKSYIDSQKHMYERPNSLYVRVVLTLEDKTWLEKLQIRKPGEEPREHGEGARRLDEKEADDSSDWQRGLAEWPIVEERMDELDECCDDVIPAFCPAFIAATA
jgi:hypothetical protein